MDRISKMSRDSCGTILKAINSGNEEMNQFLRWKTAPPPAAMPASAPASKPASAPPNTGNAGATASAPASIKPSQTLSQKGTDDVKSLATGSRVIGIDGITGSRTTEMGGSLAGGLGGGGGVNEGGGEGVLDVPLEGRASRLAAKLSTLSLGKISMGGGKGGGGEEGGAEGGGGGNASVVASQVASPDFRSTPMSPDEGELGSLHYGTKPGQFETLKIHFPTSEGVSEVSERANE